ncbi:unnamed protein product [Prorocentrum cordatum]|uniref:5-formyltetrahydrofolate cyclo-ligase n=1 Tax=Prorocentrum cordatum TaxID=2364126 RepID=A0ABN9SQC1_9DINO|nr:unnamed protein product [Polarella glacialis]
MGTPAPRQRRPRPAPEAAAQPPRTARRKRGSRACATACGTLWTEAADAVLFPRPCHGRIPHCAGSAAACGRLLASPWLREARVVKVHPSIGAAALRSALVMAGRTVLVPPYPGADYLYLKLHRDLAPSSCSLVHAGDKREYLRWGAPLGLAELPPVDAVVVAACAVAPNGVRLGKGKGYGEVEWGILSELGLVDPATTPVLTLCHDLQLVASEDLPCSVMADHDLPVDAVATPSRLLRCASAPANRLGCAGSWSLRALLSPLPLFKTDRKDAR